MLSVTALPHHLLSSFPPPLPPPPFSLVSLSLADSAALHISLPPLLLLSVTNYAPTCAHTPLDPSCHTHDFILSSAVLCLSQMHFPPFLPRPLHLSDVLPHPSSPPALSRFSHAFIFPPHLFITPPPPITCYLSEIFLLPLLHLPLRLIFCSSSIRKQILFATGAVEYHSFPTHTHTQR